MENQPSIDGQFLRLVHQNIEDNLGNENFSVEELAKSVNLSRSMLHRKLMKLTGKPASNLITEKRLLRAKELLENDVATASEIAYTVGFNSPSYFTKVFKEHFKVSPGDVRKGASVSRIEAPPDQHLEIKDSALKSISRRNPIVLVVLLTVIVSIPITFYALRKNKPVEKSIAILPFDNLSSDDENQYFADGIVEDLLNRISQIEELKVISRTSSEVFRNKGSKTIPEIAELLGANYIVEGTVQRESDNVRINIQLIDAKNDEHILSKQYDRKLSEVFEIQSEIASQIASELSLILTQKEISALNQDQTTNLKAFEYNQLGRYHLNKRTREDLFLSVKYFRLAIREDPDYALAYAELADSYFILPWYGHIERKTGRDSAVYLALKALQLDSNLGEAHTILGAIYHEFDLEYKAARREFLKAIELKPNHAPAYQYYSEFLCTDGKQKEAREILNKAIRIDPYSYIIRYASCLLYFKEDNFEQALAENQICQALVNDQAWAVSLAFRIHWKMKNEQAALESFKKLVKITENWSPEEVDRVYRIGGINSLLRWWLKDGLNIRTNSRAVYYALLGEEEKTLDILESNLNVGLLEPFVMTDPSFANLRFHPRFIAIKKKLGLPPA